MARTGRTATATAAVSGLLLLAGCATAGGPAGTAPPELAARSPADTGGAPDDSAAAATSAADEATGTSAGEAGAAATAGSAERSAEPSEDLIDARTGRQFRELFGSDPLGLARMPENVGRYEIPLRMNDAVRWWIDRFSHEIHDRFATYLERAGRYEPMIRTRLREAGLPEDLVYKALIESGMNPDAYSRARAVGMWQFMSFTARKYGLEVSYWVDERRDPVAATDAAIRYLSDLYAEFGSWYLAAAAYNAGEGRLRWSISRAGTDDFWDLVDRRVLPRETRNHVPKIIAAALIARNPDAHGFGHVEPAEPMRYDVVTVPDATSLDVIARAAGTTEERIRRLNPKFRRHVTPPDRRSEVRVPEGTAGEFRTAYAEIPPEERVTWLVHRVTRGQTLSGIAGRYGTSVRAIRAANDGISPRRLQIGQRLVVPRSGRPGDGRLASARPRGPSTVVVRRGDTLWDIARRHDVSTRKLMAWNGLRSATIRPGDRLKVRR